MVAVRHLGLGKSSAGQDLQPEDGDGMAARKIR